MKLEQKKKKILLPKLTSYQTDIVNIVSEEGTKITTVLKGRQCGLSFLCKNLIIKWCLSESNVRVNYVTPTGKLASHFHSELVKTIPQLIKSSNGTNLLIEFVSGSVVQFFSAQAGDTMRGFNAEYTILDEAAFMSDDFFNLILLPTTLVKGRKMLICSTPFLAQGFFHTYYNFGLDETIKNCKSYFTNIYSNPFVTPEDIENIKRLVSDRVFRQEYLGEFLSGDGAVFSNFKQCINLQPELTGKYYASIDFGKTDYTVLTIINNLKQVVDIYRINNMDYILQVKLLIEKLNYWKPITTLCESNSMGTVIIELLKKDYTGKIRSITLTNGIKKQMIEELIVAFESKTIGIPNFEPLLNELSSFSMEYNHKTQNVYYNAPSGLHDDCVISLAYSLYCINNLRTSSYNLM